MPITYLSADHLVEQLPPVEAWGKRFFTMPLATRNPSAQAGKGDVVRVVAARDNTEVTTPHGTVVLNRGQFTEQVFDGPAEVTSKNGPVLVVQ